MRDQLEPWAAGGGKTPIGWEKYLKNSITPRYWMLWKRWPWRLWDWWPVPLWLGIVVATLVIAIGVSVGFWPSLIGPSVACKT